VIVNLNIEPHKPSHLNNFLSKKYLFSQDYCSGNLANIKSKLSELKGKPNLKYLEIGCFEGASLFFQFENILTGPGCKATVIDFLADEFDYVPRFYSNLAKSGFQDQIQLLKGQSQLLLPTLEKDSFDLIMIDGDHSAKAVYLDVAYSWPLLKVGGYLIFDDYLWLKETGFPRDRRPELAIDAFLDSFRDEIEIIDMGYQVIIKRIPLVAHADYESVVYKNMEYDWINKTLKTQLDRQIVPTTLQEANQIEKLIKLERQNPKFNSIFIDHHAFDLRAFLHNVRCAFLIFLGEKKVTIFLRSHSTWAKIFNKMKFVYLKLYYKLEYFLRRRFK
jgi:predicted O-methyltransferase YrrM